MRKHFFTAGLWFLGIVITALVSLYLKEELVNAAIQAASAVIGRLADWLNGKVIPRWLIFSISALGLGLTWMLVRELLTVSRLENHLLQVQEEVESLKKKWTASQSKLSACQIELAASSAESTERKNAAAIDALTSGLIKGFNEAADDLSAGSIQLSPPQIDILKHLAAVNEMPTPRGSPQTVHPSADQIKEGIGLSKLRAEQLLDDLFNLKMITRSHNSYYGQRFYLAPLGRKWLLDNEHAE